MEKWDDFYSVLQVHPDAEPDIIQSAYKRLCRKYHPDVNPSPAAADRMTRINGAYEILGSEPSRRRYHQEWLRHNAQNKSAHQQTRVEVRERVVYVNREPSKPAYGGGTAAAYQTLHDYFSRLSKGDLSGAFALVSGEDKKKISFESFVEWQESVAAHYEVGGFELTLFKRYDDLKIDPKQKYAAEEYTVKISEKTKSTGKVNEYSLTKYALREGSLWRVYLGYRDLTPLMMQFKTMVTTPEEAQILGQWNKYKETHDVFMGLYNRKGFEDCLALEVYRNKRFQRPFSLAVFHVSLPEGLASEHRERIIKYMGYILSREVRLTDSVAYIEADRFGVVMGESDKKASSLASRRILRAVRHDIAACFDFEIQICAGLTEYNGQPVDGLIAGCMRTIQAAMGGRGIAGA